MDCNNCTSLWLKNDCDLQGYYYLSREHHIPYSHINEKEQVGEKKPIEIGESSKNKHQDVEEIEEIEEFHWYSSLYKAATNGEWSKAQEIFNQHETAIRARIRGNSETVLHVAVAQGNENLYFIQQLLNSLSPQDLEITNRDGCTALNIAAKIGSVEIAQILIEKKQELLYISDHNSNFPIHNAAVYGHKRMILYLLKVTKEGNPNPYDPEGSGSVLLHLIIKAGFYDVALQLLEKTPDLASCVQYCKSALFSQAQNPAAFQVEKQNIFKYMLHKYCSKHTKEATIKRHDGIELVKLLCREASSKIKGASDAALRFKLPLLVAAENGISEIVKEVLETFANTNWYTSGNNSNLFRLAIKYRRHKVYNLLFEMGDLHVQDVRQSLEKRNTILHLVAILPPSDCYRVLPGAALQLQRELQWYKEVESLVQPAFRNKANMELKTAWELFRETHHQLRNEAEQWMRGTASSCTVAAVLIATVVFAAAITVPGGNQPNGLPVLKSQRSFIVFAVADAVSLFSSCTSILFFLSILTSRYSELDFLRSLPLKLISGLISLFVSVAAMMVAFSSTLYLVFGPRRTWKIALIALPSALLICTFLLTEITLFKELVSSAGGTSMFKKRNKRRTPSRLTKLFNFFNKIFGYFKKD